ncbi:MAG: cytochrome c oxidase subunit I [Balneola sp.]|uniref:cytochrome c oxidase subunit I n=1 Tax=Balneola sp. EhC07 TaxID=1849360 RepID=UPI0007F4149C|nr:cytochrome c oxidase subunit I [Balneola sp. EhC07]MAB65591.1 cytochrome c oxidase subunit I [Bacteroidota bacterium]MBO6572290.1 cytochrome c oxidase subunit I [Balneola sp.]MBO6622552.1 cytochrome c oxidase subunit I [Balneola sp.]MBO6650894.1 cytochrome c oxidase subunit I [Balneola sp.]MBO6711836.1 cytochrome c oxidase subunit I [Balneola sp.]|tara:strand:+ start:22989 stop:24743 length:1755 start_codon:yes stop_codon:yes gene_type:complete
MATAEVSNKKTLKVQRFKPSDNPSNTYLTDEKGVWAWMTTVDHKKIGIMYLVAVAIFFAVGGALALLLRTELMTPAKTFIEADTYNQLFTLHGAIMVFFVLVPSIPAALGNFIMPMQLGAKDVAFPKLNLASFYIYVAGAIFTFIALAQHGLDTGWTFYTPYSTESSSSVIWVTMGVFILGFSSILTGTNFITTIHKMRAPGITWGKLPLNVWALYATSIIQVLATPVLAITVLLLTMERWLGFGIFDPALGGDPVLFQHFFWFYSHPAVYIMIVPGFGIISEVISTFSKKTVFGYWAIALSSLAIAFIGFLVWGHHMFTSGQSAVATTVFSFLTFLVGIPTGIKIFNWIATLYKGSIKMDTPMIYVFIFLFLFSIGGFTGIMLGALSVDIHLHDTYYVVAHFHYVMMGGTLIALLAGLHFWWPKMTGKLYNEKLAKIASVFIFVGFNVTFLPQFVMGAQGMPRRYYNYVDQFTAFHQTSTIGSYLLGVGFLIILYYLMHSLFKGAKSPANPWGSRGLEWQATSPPDFHNFDHTPVVIHGPYDYHQPMEEFQLGLAVDTNGHDSETAKEVVDKEREQWKNYSLG